MSARFPAPFQGGQECGSQPCNQPWADYRAVPRWLANGQNASQYQNAGYQSTMHPSYYQNAMHVNEIPAGGRGRGRGRAANMAFETFDAALNVAAAKWRCEKCDKQFLQESQLISHTKQHVSCEFPGCEFSAAKKVVIAHKETAHGKNIQSTVIPSLDTPEEIEAWREARRRNWPGSKRKHESGSQNSDESVKRHHTDDGPLSSLNAYNSGSDSGSEEIVKTTNSNIATDKRTNSIKKRVCRFYNSKKGCRKGDNCPNEHTERTKSARHKAVVAGTLFERLGGVKPQQQKYSALIQCIQHVVLSGFLR
eukprot:CFRG3022T1